MLGLVVAYALMGSVILLARLKHLSINRQIAISVIRMSLQLVGAGVVLEVVFDIDAWYVVVGILVFLFGMASRIVFSRLGVKSAHLQRNIVISIAVGSGSVLALFIIVIVGQDPWYDPRYMIPIAGMIIGNGMNGCALAFERFYSSLQKERMRILTMLSLGATASEATERYFSEAFRAAFLPQLITMTAMGIVTLPGMMTGQILSGTAPMTAIRYQIAIMMAIVSSNALVAYTILYLESRVFFNERHQFNEGI